MTPPILWTPDAERISQAAITRYAGRLADVHGVEADGYHDLWRWSVTEIESFWASIWQHFDVRASEPYERVLGSRAMPGAEWFPGARLNSAAAMQRRSRFATHPSSARSPRPRGASSKTR